MRASPFLESQAKQEKPLRSLDRENDRTSILFAFVIDKLTTKEGRNALLKLMK